ncbi:MAG: DUF368 domain-containing protein [Myxococcales bacterium]|nr:DUF368 domain-containing protein [Myxococcales bacterium]
MDHTSGSHFPPDPPEPEEKVGAVYGYGPWPMLGLRAAVGGVLMGLANLVPGISGGTMLVASGIYPRFIEAIADLSRLRFRKRSLFVLGVIGLSAALSIVLLAGTVKSAVVHQRWAMYSLFIGLTLGGVPVVWSMARPKTRGVVVGFACGLVAMIALAILQSREDTSAIAQDGVLWMFVAGVLGASAMILPGVSGGYILLLMGVYVPILGAIDDAKTAVRAGDLHAALGPGIAVVLPVGLGVLLGVLIVSNLIEKLLLRYEKPTLGALLGLLVGAVFGLWPFQHGVPPEVGAVFRGQVMTEALIAKVPESKWPTAFFSPSVTQVLGALGLIVLGFAFTALLAKFMNREPDDLAVDPADSAATE